jgi:hypothetical protein
LNIGAGLRARAALEAEIWVVRQQINVLRRAAPRRQSFGTFGRLIFVGPYRLFPKACDAQAIVKPDTIIRWHRAGFRAWWRTNCTAGDLQAYPRDGHCQSVVGAPRIHGELLKLGVAIRRVRSIGIRDCPTSPRSPWQNAYAERLIGSIRRECLDDIVVFDPMCVARLAQVGR